MNKKPSLQDRMKTAKALKDIKSSVLQFSAFGDDHHAAIDAQIHVIEEYLSEESIDSLYPYDEGSCNLQSITSAALDARQWLNGDFEDDLLEGWKELVGRKPVAPIKNPY